MNTPFKLRGLLTVAAIAIVTGIVLLHFQALPQSRPLQPSASSTPQTAATPSVGTPTAVPALITINTPTVVTVTTAISDPSVIANGVNLLRLNAIGTSSILGVMHDDGNNGDALAGDNVYTIQVAFNEPAAGQIHLEVSAAFRGLLKRVASKPTIVNVWNLLTNTTTAHFSINYPPGWAQHSYQDTYTISSTTLAPVLEGDAGNEIQINILPANNTSTILGWLQDYYRGELVISSQLVTYYTNPAGVQFAIVHNIPGLSSDNANAYALLSNSVIQLSVSPASKFGSLFTSMLFSFRTN